MRNKIVIWGAGGHALVVADILRTAGNFEIVGFLDDADSNRHGKPFCGATILGGRDQLDTLREQGVVQAILAFGNCAARLKFAEVLRSKGFGLATAVHPRATVASDVTIGPGSQIVAGAVINPAARIGENVIVNTCAGVDHECVLEDGAHVGPGARLGGKVSVGRAAWVGMGASILPGFKIGEGAIIGAGAVVLEDVPAGVVAFGVPAKVQRKVSES